MRKIPLNSLDLAEYVRPGDVIAWPQGPGEPLALTERLGDCAPLRPACTLLFGMTITRTLQPGLADDFRLLALNGAGASRRVTGVSEVLAGHVSGVPSLLRDRHLRVDVVLIQVRPLGAGRYTLGVIADYTQALIDSARTVVALLNDRLPPLEGDAVVLAEDIDVLVDGDHRIADLADPVPSEQERAVARQVAELIPDGATVQLGVGTLPVAVAQQLHSHRELGVHSGVVSDVLVALVERGVVTNARKGCDEGVSVTGGLFGTQRLRDFAADAQVISLRNVDYTHHIARAAALSRFHAVNAAVEVDLTGQVNAEAAAGRYLGAVGGHTDFSRMGRASPGGCAVIALPSTTQDGSVSRLVASLECHPVTTSRADVDVVVTEHGAAWLRGCPLRERMRRMIAIAHPDHRGVLEEQASVVASAQGLT